MRFPCLQSDLAVKAVDAKMSRSTADLIGVTGALGCAFTRVIGAVHELVPAEALATVLRTSVFSAYRVAVLDAVARRNLLSPPLRPPVPQGARIHGVEEAARSFPNTRLAID